MVNKYKRILLIELAGIGDAVLSMPAIRNLRRNYPHSTLYYLTFSEPAQVINGCPYLDDIYVLSKKKRYIFTNLSIAKKLRDWHPQVAVNLYQHYTLKGTLNCFFLLKYINPSITVGRNTDGKGFFYDIKIEDTLDTQRHDVEYKLDLLRALGCKIEDKHLELWPGQDDIDRVSEFLNNRSISESDFLIGINPGAHRLTHRWSWENFAQVADILIDRFKAKIIITGSKEESLLGKLIVKKVRRSIIDTVGVFTLTQLLALIKRCNLFITNDTGPMHIANALRIPMVAIMGPGGLKTAPYQRENCIIVRKEVSCSPCYKFKCKDLRCLKGVTVEEVIEAVEKVIRGAKD